MNNINGSYFWSTGAISSRIRSILRWQLYFSIIDIAIDLQSVKAKDNRNPRNRTFWFPVISSKVHLSRLMFGREIETENRNFVEVKTAGLCVRLTP